MLSRLVRHGFHSRRPREPGYVEFEMHLHTNEISIGRIKFNFSLRFYVVFRKYTILIHFSPIF